MAIQAHNYKESDHSWWIQSSKWFMKSNSASQSSQYYYSSQTSPMTISPSSFIVIGYFSPLSIRSRLTSWKYSGVSSMNISFWRQTGQLVLTFSHSERQRKWYWWLHYILKIGLSFMMVKWQIGQSYSHSAGMGIMWYYFATGLIFTVKQPQLLQPCSQHSTMRGTNFLPKHLAQFDSLTFSASGLICMKVNSRITCFSVSCNTYSELQNSQGIDLFSTFFPKSVFLGHTSSTKSFILCMESQCEQQVAQVGTA